MVLLLLAVLALLALACLLSIALGSRITPFGDVLDSLRGRSGDEYVNTVVRARLERTALAMAVGAALALSGTLIQGVSQNPLADPGLLGINAGAAAGMVTGLLLLGADRGTAVSVWTALLGAAVAAVLVTSIGSMGASGASMVRLVLAGAVVAAVLTAYVQAVALRNPLVFDSYRFWVVGSLADGGLSLLRSTAPFLLVGLAVGLACAGGLNAVALGSETATALGVRTGLVRTAALGAATLLAATATAAAGPIVFVGLAVPHIVRAIFGLDMRRQVLGSLVVGPLVLVTADVIGRVIVRPDELMVGVVTAFVGAPVLLLAVRRLGNRA